MKCCYRITCKRQRPSSPSYRTYQLYRTLSIGRWSPEEREGHRRKCLCRFPTHKFSCADQSLRDSPGMSEDGSNWFLMELRRSCTCIPDGRLGDRRLETCKLARDESGTIATNLPTDALHNITTALYSPHIHQIHSEPALVATHPSSAGYLQHQLKFSSR